MQKMAEVQVKARIDFAPDGRRWQTIKTAKTAGKLWDYFIGSLDIRTQLAVNPYAKFRLVGEAGLIIGELPKKE